MDRFKKFIFLGLSLIMILVFIPACSSDKSNDISQNESIEDSGPLAGNEVDFSQGKGESSLEPEKVITTVNMHFETTDFTATQKNLTKIIKKHDSYVENSNVRYNTYYNAKNYRYASYIIRVPQEKVSSFKEDLNGLGHIVSENTNKEDVSKEYNDTQSRLNILQTKEERLLSLLQKAEKIEDIIALENQLNEVVYEKERLKSRLLNIDDKVDFSTIHLEIEEVERLSSTETVETSFGTKIKNALSNSLYSFKVALENFIIWLIYFLPFGLILLLLGFISFKVFKKVRRDKKQ